MRSRPAYNEAGGPPAFFRGLEPSVARNPAAGIYRDHLRQRRAVRDPHPLAVLLGESAGATRGSSPEPGQRSARCDGAQRSRSSPPDAMIVPSDVDLSEAARLIVQFIARFWSRAMDASTARARAAMATPGLEARAIRRPDPPLKSLAAPRMGFKIATVPALGPLIWTRRDEGRFTSPICRYGRMERFGRRSPLLQAAVIASRRSGVGGAGELDGRPTCRRCRRGRLRRDRSRARRPCRPAAVYRRAGCITRRRSSRCSSAGSSPCSKAACRTMRSSASTTAAGTAP